MDKEVRLTTFDNPWNPFTNWNEWWYWDEHIGHYHTCGGIARTFDQLTDDDREQYKEFGDDAAIALEVYLHDHFFSHKRVERPD